MISRDLWCLQLWRTPSQTGWRTPAHTETLQPVLTAGAECLSCSTTIGWRYLCRGRGAGFYTAGAPDPLSGPGKEGAVVVGMPAAHCPPLQRVPPRLSFSALLVAAVPEIKWT